MITAEKARQLTEEAAFTQASTAIDEAIRLGLNTTKVCIAGTVMDSLMRSLRENGYTVSVYKHYLYIFW